MSKLNIIFLCGAGGTGKSTVAGLLESRDDTLVMRSSTRDTYRRLGIVSESAAFKMDFEEQKHLQDEIMKDHLLNLCVARDRAVNKGADFLVVDRGPYDHLAYWVRTNALNDSSKNLEFMSIYQRVNSTVSGFDAKIIGFFDFPYPISWPTQDGMRDQNQVKIMEMSLMTSGLIWRFHSSAQSLQKTFLNHVPIDTPEWRAGFIIQQMRYHLMRD